jgi:hypothetical protein
MAVRRRALDVAVVAVAIAGLTHAEHTFSSAGNQLVVSGSQEGVERFASLQEQSRLELVNLTSKSLGGGAVTSSNEPSRYLPWKRFG